MLNTSNGKIYLALSDFVCQHPSQQLASLFVIFASLFAQVQLKSPIVAAYAGYGYVSHLVQNLRMHELVRKEDLEVKRSDELCKHPLVSQFYWQTCPPSKISALKSNLGI